MKYEEAKEILNANDKISYPKLQNIYKNKNLANMLYDDYAGKLGELTAITQYTYEHISLNSNVDISNIMLLIAKQEMKHLDIIGNLINLLGLQPYYMDSKLHPWDSKNIKYDIGDIKEMMEYNIYTERMAIEGYQKIIMRTRSINIQRILSRIILDEKSHIEIFRKIISNNIKSL